LAGLFAVILAALVLPVPAYGTPVHTAAAAPGACPGNVDYPVVPGATVQSSTTRPRVGQKIEVSGIKYCPNEDVNITISGQHVGTGHTDSHGSFDPEVVVPGPPGQKPLCGIGASGLPNDADCLTLTVTASGKHPEKHHTSKTGVEVASLVAIAAILLVSGIVFVSAGRRRNTSVVG
jgi:hypothetical protein